MIDISHIAVIGALGQLGRQTPGGIRIGHEEMDIAVRDQVRRRLDLAQAAGVVLTAAYTDVDGCETYPERAFAVNAEGPAHVAEWCQENNAWLVYVSSNCVFDGRKVEPYIEEDQPAPISVYGKSKLAGERAVQERLRHQFIVRSSWIFGPGGSNFVIKILAAAAKQPVLKGVVDEVASPTHAGDLGPALLEIAAAGKFGIYHLTNAGECSRFDYMRHILTTAGLTNALEETTLDRFQRPSRPPAQSALANVRAAALGIHLRPWQEAVSAYIAELAGEALTAR